MKSQEWVGDTNHKITGHEEFMKKCIWCGTLSVGDRAPIRFWCEKYVQSCGETELTGVLTDTSERVQGITVQARITRHEKMVVIGGTLVLFPSAQE